MAGGSWCIYVLMGVAVVAVPSMVVFLAYFLDNRRLSSALLQP